MDTYIQLLIYLAPTAIVGLFTALIALWNSHTNLKLHISEHYIKKDIFAEVQKEIRQMNITMYQIAGKLGISAQGIDKT